MKIPKTRNAIKVDNIQEVVANRNIVKTTPFVYKSTGESYYLLDGKKVSIEDFESMFPLDLKPVAPKGANYDKTKNWVFGDKSY
jgi:hypothetical protein